MVFEDNENLPKSSVVVPSLESVNITFAKGTPAPLSSTTTPLEKSTLIDPTSDNTEFSIIRYLFL